MKRISSLLVALLVAALMLSMVPVALAEEEIMSPYGRYEETVVLTTAKRMPSKANFLPGDDVENNPMSRYILEKVNVQSKVEWEVEATEFANKLALMLASNTLPDSFTLTREDYVLFKQLLDNDLLADLTDVAELCANDYVKTTLATYEGKNFDPFRNEEGRLFAYAGGRYGYEHNQLWLRQDWLDAAGLARPTTIEDLENVLTVWKDNPPVEGYVGMLLNDRYVGGVYDGNSFSPLFATFQAYPNMWVKNDAGEIIWGSVAPEVKAGLAIMADWYKKGLIDQQFATRTASGAREALITGNLAGAAFAPWWYTYSIGDFPKNVPDGEIVPMNAPLDPEGKFNISFPGVAGDYVCVRKDYAHPEAVFKVINCEFDMWRGFDEAAAESVKATRENNVDWGYMFPTSGFNIEPMNVVPEVGLICKALVETGTTEGVTIGNPQHLQVAEAAQRYSQTKVADGVDWVEYYGRYVGCNIMYTPEVVINYPAYFFVTESMADLKPNLDTLEQTTFLKIITGELPVDAFDQFVEDWYAQGGQKMTDEVRAIAGA